MRRVSWNCLSTILLKQCAPSRLAWGVWVEIFVCLLPNNIHKRHASHEACELKFFTNLKLLTILCVTPRMRRVSWNLLFARDFHCFLRVTPRMRRVSWNTAQAKIPQEISEVTPRMRRVSWNTIIIYLALEHTEVTPRMRRVSWNFLFPVF